MTNATPPAHDKPATKRKKIHSLRGLQTYVASLRLHAFRDYIIFRPKTCLVFELKSIICISFPFTETLSTYVVNAHTRIQIQRNGDGGDSGNNNNIKFEIENLCRGKERLWKKYVFIIRSHEYYIWRCLLV